MIARLIFLIFFATSLFADKNVLVLHSYHHGLHWTDGISKGIISAFEHSGEKINIYFEYLDSKRNLESSFMEITFSYFLLKHNNTSFDAIIASDNDALAFLNQYKHEIFPNTPVIFCGINNFDQKMVSNLPQATGVKEVVDYDSTLALATELFPQRKKILVFSDNTITGMKIREELEKVENSFSDTLDFYYFWDFETPELEAFIRKNEKEILAYALAFNRDKEGNFFDYNTAIDFVKSLLGPSIPIFGSWDFFLGRGIVGGVIVSGFNQGKAAGELAIRVLKGEEANNIPPQTTIGKDGIILDYAQMQHFSLNAPKKPLASRALYVRYINKPIGFFEQYRKVLIPLGLLFLVLFIGSALREFRNREKTRILKETNALLDSKIALAVQESEKSEKLFRFVAESSLYLIWIVDMEHKISYINGKVKEYFGFSPEQIIGAYNFPFLKTSYSEELHKQIERLHQNPSLESIEFEFYCNALNKYMKNTIVPIYSNEGEMAGYKGIIEDITEEKVSLGLLVEAAQTDTLTGLLNRKTLEETYSGLFEEMHSSQKEFCLMMIDIDHFKKINDNAGHLAGDSILKELAQELKAYFRKSDLIFRYGGEEFVVLLPDISRKDALRSAQTLKKRISEKTFKYGGVLMPITISIGLAMMNKDDDALNSIIAKSDEALYKAKQNGRNRVEVFGL